MSTSPDMLRQFGGQPVGADHRFDGWWGGKVYFVDYDNGTAGVNGYNDMNRPGKNIQTSIDAAGTDATIYVRPREFSSEDPQAITPAAAHAENIHIDKAKTNMSLIGTGKGLGHAAVHKAYLASYSGLTTPVISIYAPGCVIEGFRSQPASSAATGIFYSINDDTYDGGNTTIINCDFHDANTTGAIRLCSTWQMSVIGNRFVNCDVGLYVTTSYSVPQIFELAHNKFSAVAGEVSCNVYFYGGVRRLLAYDNYHGMEQPTLAAPNMYYAFTSTASTGMISGDYFGAYDVTAEALCTLNGVNLVGCYSSEGLVVEAS